jgi:selenocysteine lyase/cysteine desulfurase
VSYKHLFQRALAAAPERLHFAAHSHHLWPDASYLGQLAAWDDAARLADRKWERVMGEIWPAAQHHVAAELGLPDPSTIVFAPNTHDLLLRIASALPRRHAGPLRILASDGEFHSFRRQSERWEEAGTATVERVPLAELAERARQGRHDLIFVSQVQFGTGLVFDDMAALAECARPEGPWVVVDGYHGFMALETDLAALADRVFYMAGGYKYAMSGEGCAFLHAPPGFGPRPEITGWYAEFEDLALPPGVVGYAPDARRFMGATFDPSGIYRFVAVRDMLARERLSTAAIVAHVDGLRAQLLDGLPIAAELLNPGSPARFLALRSPHAQRWKAEFEAEDVIVDVRGDVLRIGLGLYQDARDVTRLKEALAEL